MINAQETKRLLKEFSWDCYEFHANDLRTDDDSKVWPLVIKDLEATDNDPFSPQGELFDSEAKKDFIEQLKYDLGI